MSISQQSLRFATPAELAEAMQQARSSSLHLFDCFVDVQNNRLVTPPRWEFCQPPLWQLGYISWFWEWFVLRDAETSYPASAVRSSLLSRGDDWFAANTVAHASRWSLDLPSSGAIKTYCREILDRCLDKLSRTANHDASLYPFRLALAHEEMLAENSLCVIQALGLPAPARYRANGVYTWAQGEIRFPGGTMMLGSDEGGFVFDNEQACFERRVASFHMDANLISNAQFAEFVEDGGYQRSHLWSQAGLDWLMQQERSAPQYWQRASDSVVWQTLRFGQSCQLDPAEPVRHVNLYEAQAYCAWAERRLPLEEEWEFAVRSEHPALRWGDLLEWTASAFMPYPGFRTGPWLEYSAPHFGSHQVLRGSSFASSRRLHSASLRHFALPHSAHLFSGFRTCAW